MKNKWQLLTFPPKEDLAQARMQCHQAIQNVAAVGRSFLPKSDGDEFGNLEWDAHLQRLVGRWVKADVTFRSSICIKDFEVYLVNEKIETISSFAMQGKTQTDVMVWLEHELSRLGVDFSKINLNLPYQIPKYATAKGEKFNVNNIKACQELSRLYHNTELLLKALSNSEDQLGEIKCWPHHFDTSTTMMRLDTGDPETSRKIGIGMSPGDQYYDEPYFYVSPWPYPMDDLLSIDHLGGHWHQDDWVGAVLPLSAIANENLIQDQRYLVTAFYEEVIRFLKKII